MTRRKKPFNYVIFLCFSRRKIGKAERDKALFKEGTQDEFLNVKVAHPDG